VIFGKTPATLGALCYSNITDVEIRIVLDKSTRYSDVPDNAPDPPEERSRY